MKTSWSSEPIKPETDAVLPRCTLIFLSGPRSGLSGLLIEASGVGRNESKFRAVFNRKIESASGT